jgi:hypothetical protein
MWSAAACGCFSLACAIAPHFRKALQWITENGIRHNAVPHARFRVAGRLGKLPSSRKSSRKRPHFILFPYLWGAILRPEERECQGDGVRFLFWLTRISLRRTPMSREDAFGQICANYGCPLGAPCSSMAKTRRRDGLDGRAVVAVRDCTLRNPPRWSMALPVALRNRPRWSMALPVVEFEFLYEGVSI